MKKTALIRLTLPLVLAGATTSDPQEAAITKTAEAFVEAFQKGDAKAVASFWTPDGDYVDLTGRLLNGRPAIEKDFAHHFAENKGSCSATGNYGGSISHSSSSSGGYGSYSHSGSTTATGRYGNTYSSSHSSSGSYYHGSYSTGGYGAYRYGGCYGGGGFHAVAVSGPNGTAYAAGVYRRPVW
jgi:SnoaL-like domain